jgi:hypothetical protein
MIYLSVSSIISFLNVNPVPSESCPSLFYIFYRTGLTLSSHPFTKVNGKGYFYNEQQMSYPLPLALANGHTNYI